MISLIEEINNHTRLSKTIVCNPRRLIEGVINPRRRLSKTIEELNNHTSLNKTIEELNNHSNHTSLINKPLEDNNMRLLT